ncbi:hypothetical protein CVT25_004707 [Psilocybe cyanescens]|uniref:Uncharacterized protein n=1 Tax=Psilocybe cyanescens TaxID=93625 RepID=A0A409XIV7_PSICY|nr:hypothetical protein CVT25_004707 [Psilocybe cyanescens]
MHYTNYRFRNFVQYAGKGAFMDAEFYPMRWYLFNTGEAFKAYSWATQMLPLFLDRSGHSEELIAYACQARIMCNDYLNFTYTLEQQRRSAQAAVKAYLRRVEDEWT